MGVGDEGEGGVVEEVLAGESGVGARVQEEVLKGHLGSQVQGHLAVHLLHSCGIRCMHASNHASINSSVYSSNHP